MNFFSFPYIIEQKIELTIANSTKAMQVEWMWSPKSLKRVTYKLKMNQ